MTVFSETKVKPPDMAKRYCRLIIQPLCSVSLILFLVLFFNGCALRFPPPEPEKKTYRSLPDKYRNKALEHEQKGRLREALIDWRIVQSFQPHDYQEISAKIKILQSKARRKAEAHFQKGVAFFHNRALQDARREFLLTLSYEPDHTQALSYLQTRLQKPVFRTYVTRKGDTAGKIARKEYHDPGKAFLVTVFNSISPSDELRPGMSLKLVILDQDIVSDSKFAEMMPQKGGVVTKPLRHKKKAFAAVSRDKAGGKTSRSVQKKESGSMADALKYQKAKDLLEQEEHFESLRILRTLDRNYRDVTKLIASTEVFLKQEADAHYRKGISYFLSEKLDMAIQEWEEVLRLSPNHLQAKKDLRNARRLRQKMKNY
ncbi:MAG: tetratricopeptide repeat protein [Thermodesulfobacteriota bacterium]|nr:tetratricopeptide repeat protein [Thermodesulfobacteriota bacterium]